MTDIYGAASNVARIAIVRTALTQASDLLAAGYFDEAQKVLFDPKVLRAHGVLEKEKDAQPKRPHVALGETPEGYVRVVTRYGGSQHLAAVEDGERHYTLCSGTSAWTLASWEETPDHPTLRPEEIPKLPPCRRCYQRVNGESA